MYKEHYLIKIPKVSSRLESQTEVFLTDIHRQLIDLYIGKLENSVSFELVFKKKYLYFYFTTNSCVTDIIIGQLYSHFPGIELEKTSDFLPQLTYDKLFIGRELHLDKNDIYPIKTYLTTVNDSFVGLTGTFSKMNEDESAFIQIVITPVKENWWEENKRYLKHLLRITYESFEARNAMYAKFAKLYFNTNIRIAVASSNLDKAHLKIQSLTQTFAQFENGIVNGIVPGRLLSGNHIFRRFQTRSSQNTFILNTEELASIYHFPETTTAPNVIRVLSQKVAAPFNLPQADMLKQPDISTFAFTNYRNDCLPFGIKRADRRRHLYIVGKTGMGKSKLLELLMLSDIYNGCGFAALDPHGDLAEQILRCIPEDRINDVIYYNPADEKFPIGFNPLEVSDRTYFQQVVTGFIAIFKKLFIFGWNPRLEHMIRFITLALLETKSSSIVDIPRLLTNKTFRQEVISQIQDPVVLDFWTHEFASWNEKYDNEAIIPILNKVSELTSSPLIRNTLGQKKSGFSMNEIMDQNKILIANLSTGKLGEENSAFLGSMIVTQIQQAAMSRANIEEEKRQDFLLYVDEFQNFATNAFTTILSEARKYRLCLTIAHQYIDQLGPEIQKTVFGNIGSMIAFRVGAGDARILEAEFAPQFNAEDLMNLDVRQMAVKLAIDGTTATPFSAQTITMPQYSQDNSQKIIMHTHNTYSRRYIVSESEENISDSTIYRAEDDKGFDMPIV